MNEGHGHFIKSPEFLTVPQVIHNARPPGSRLSFPTLPATDLDDRAKRVENAIKEYKAESGASVDDIPWVGLPKTFWYWTSTMSHYNKSLVILPCAVTEPKNAEMVRVAVEIARRAQVSVQARAGGHSYGGYGWGGRDGTFVIGLKHLSQITVDKEAMTATIGTGALLGDVTRVLKQSGVMTPHGICPQVGVGGHATIGGQGPSSRQFGMMVDQIISFDIVLASGKYLKDITANHPQHADLFWAVRGAAASFGVVTKIVVKVYPDLTEITHWTYEVVDGTPEELSNAYDQFQAWATNPNLNRKFASTCIITNGRMAIERTFYGTQAEFEAEEDHDHLRQALDVKGVNVKVQTLKFDSHVGALIHWVEDKALSLGGGIPAKFYVKSLVLRADQPITPVLSTKLFNYIHDNAPTLALWFVLSDLQAGRSNDPDLAQTSCFGHRDGLLFFQFYAIDPNLLTPTFSPDIKKFIEGMYNVVKDGIPVDKVRVYPGYVDPDLGPDCEEIYWGDNAPKLRQLKAVYDPDDMFNNPQSVRLPGVTGPSVVVNDGVVDDGVVGKSQCCAIS